MFHIIDNTESIRTLLVEIIQNTGQEAQSFASPDDYFKNVFSDDFIKPMAVITDERLPNMTGYQMMEIVLVLYPDINFAVISGEGSIDCHFKDKVCMYLVKPFRPEMIEEMVDKFTRCYAEGASSTIGCGVFGDKPRSGVNNGACPKLISMK